jgi:hypothetical protein
MKLHGHRAALVRVATLALAFVHTFPARKHLAELVVNPGASDAWKGIGALGSVLLYLLPPRVQARALSHLWRRHRALIGVFGIALAAAHAVPAMDHLPRLLGNFTYSDAWRGMGATFAVAWFLTPVPLQARALSRLWMRRRDEFGLTRRSEAKPSVT